MIDIDIAFFLSAPRTENLGYAQATLKSPYRIKKHGKGYLAICNRTHTPEYIQYNA